MSEKQYGPGLHPGTRYVGIDQSLTGFGLTAIDLEGGYKTYVYKAPGKGIDRLLMIEEWLAGKIREIGTLMVKDAAIEAPLLMTPNALIAGQLFAIVLRTMRHADWAHTGPHYPLQVSPGSLKKYITGKGNIDKNLILLHTYKKWGIAFDDDNAADSYGLARIAAGLADTKYEQEVVKLHTDPKYRGK